MISFVRKADDLYMFRRKSDGLFVAVNVADTPNRAGAQMLAEQYLREHDDQPTWRKKHTISVGAEFGKSPIVLVDDDHRYVKTEDGRQFYFDEQGDVTLCPNG